MNEKENDPYESFGKLLKRLFKRPDRKPLDSDVLRGTLDYFGCKGYQTPEGIYIDMGRKGGVQGPFKDERMAADFFRALVKSRQDAEQEKEQLKLREEERQLTAKSAKRAKRSSKGRRDWSLVAAQLVGVATCLFLTESDNYYKLGKLIVCGISAYIAYCAATVSGRTGWAWLFGALAATYNPFLPLRMRRDDWVALDFLTGIAFVVSVFWVKHYAVQAQDLTRRVEQ